MQAKMSLSKEIVKVEITTAQQALQILKFVSSKGRSPPVRVKDSIEHVRIPQMVKQSMALLLIHYNRVLPTQELEIK